MHQKMDTMLKDLSALESKEENCALVYAKLIALPALAYLYFLLGYVGILHFAVGTHSIVLIGLIFIVALVFAKHNGEFGMCQFKRLKTSFQT
ncbi:MAG: hypothetical protein JXK50_06360, partial [Campylobacterales bacterium]|nr:hypothetical protein [Campylobacterales bacterium]